MKLMKKSLRIQISSRFCSNQSFHILTLLFLQQETHSLWFLRLSFQTNMKHQALIGVLGSLLSVQAAAFPQPKKVSLNSSQVLGWK